MAAMFLAMVWHARRRVDALQIAEGRSEERRSLLERQERFVHDASHELRTPLTIARSCSSCCGFDKDTSAPSSTWRSTSLGRSTRSSSGCSCCAAAADQPDFVLKTERRSFVEDMFVRWADVPPGPGGWARWRPGICTSTPTAARAALDALLENAVKFTRERDAIELRSRRPYGAGSVLIEVEDRGVAECLPTPSSRSTTGSHAPMLQVYPNRRRRRPRAGDRRRDRQGPRRTLHGHNAGRGFNLRAATPCVRAAGASRGGAPANALSASRRKYGRCDSLPAGSAQQCPPAPPVCRCRAGRRTGAPRRTTTAW